MGKKIQKKNVVIYQAKSGAIELRGDFSKETIWATLDQIAEVFGRDKSVISRHVKNIFKEGELDRNSVVAKNATTAADGKVYQVEYYNLDAVLSVGYRVNSKTATLFRQWATKTLRGYVINGYTIDKKRIAKNYAQFMSVIEDIKKLLPAGSATESKDVVELISLFADTWLSLNAYDRELLPRGKLTKKIVKLTADKIADNLVQLKQSLLEGNQATDIFGIERSEGSISGIVGNVMQSFGGKELYPTAEEKAAHLLYFMVKNHPFVDGNKRSGAFSFVWFLRQAGILNTAKLTPSALTALTIMVAESRSEHKEKVIKLILNLVSK
ncbi:MAG: virulence protein RhuM/Fic/DOC family protein [Candidatus Kaiserbacteria bacterium]|nr:virulence protein RhuM/Fic/DOC family protein [Candidatus Kaiserbacteria bacterium]